MLVRWGLTWAVVPLLLACYDFKDLPAPAREALELGDAALELPRSVTFDGKVLKDRPFNVFFVGDDFLRFFHPDGVPRIYQPASDGQAAVFYSPSWLLTREDDATNLLGDTACGQDCFVNLSASNVNITARQSMLQLRAGLNLLPGRYQVELRIGTGGAGNETVARYSLIFELLTLLTLPDQLTVSALGHAHPGMEFPDPDQTISPQAVTAGKVRLVIPQPATNSDTSVIFTQFRLFGGESFERVKLAAVTPAAGDTFLQAELYDSHDLFTPLGEAHEFENTSARFPYDPLNPGKTSKLSALAYDRYGQSVTVEVELASQ